MSSAAIAEPAVPERTLLELEAVIDAGLQTFVEVGSALAEIRERRLYRDQYDSFEVYCRSRFNFNRQRASQLIKAAEVSRILDSPPARASHAEALARVPDPETRQEIHDEVRAAKGSRATQADYDAEIAKRQSPRHAPDPEVGDTYVESFDQDPGDDIQIDADPDADAPLTDRAATDDAPSPTVTPDWPGSADGGVPPDAVAAADAGPTASEQPAAPATPRTNGHTSSNGKSSPHKPIIAEASSEPVAYRPVEVDGKQPQAIYPLPQEAVNFIDSHLTGEAFDEFDRLYMEHRRGVLRRRQMNGDATAAATAPTIADVKAQIDLMETGHRAICSYAFDKLDDAGKRAMLTKMQMQTQLADRTELGMARLAGSR